MDIGLDHLVTGWCRCLGEVYGDESVVVVAALEKDFFRPDLVVDAAARSAASELRRRHEGDELDQGVGLLKARVPDGNTRGDDGKRGEGGGGK